MSASATGSTSGPASYIRASAGAEVDAGKVVRFILILCVLALAGVSVATGVGAAHQNSSQARLQRAGVPVEVTVTACVASGSGVGQGIAFYDCSGNYTLDGHHYHELIGGNRASHPLGGTLRAYAVRGDPALLSTAAAVDKRFSPWTPYVTPIVLAAVTLVLALGLVLRPGRRRSRSGGSTVPSSTVG